MHPSGLVAECVGGVRCVGERQMVGGEVLHSERVGGVDDQRHCERRLEDRQ
jgi:hypothetical protein